MKTQTFKAKDVKSAINLVNSEFGDRAIILSTKKIMVLLRLRPLTMMRLLLIIKKKLRKKRISQMFFERIKTKKSN